jgi:hypothetical protein
VGSLPGIAIACEGPTFEEEFGKVEGGEVIVAGFGGRGCRGNIRVEDRSTVRGEHRPVRVLSERGIECTIKIAGCVNFEFRRNGDRCESELELPLRTPEYEFVAEFEGVRRTERVRL